MVQSINIDSHLDPQIQAPWQPPISRVGDSLVSYNFKRCLRPWEDSMVWTLKMTSVGNGFAFTYGEFWCPC